MAQRSGKRQPVYSADALALRYMAGLMLVALGVMMFLAVELRMSGNVFEAVRQVCYGLAGGLAAALPALPVWAGVLVIVSASRKAPVRSFLFAALAFWGLCAFIVLLTKIGQQEYLADLYAGSDRSWTGVIRQGYLQSVTLKASGGALGVILAYPLWSLTGPILAAVVLFLLTLVFLLTAVSLTPARIRDLATGKIRIRWGRKPKDQAMQEEQQIAWQQEQERQRQAAYAQQQAYILQQQEAARQSAEQRAAAQRQQGRGFSGTTARQPVTDNSVMDWQMQLAGSQPVSGGTGRSQIFTGSPGQESTQQHRSAIFGPRGGNSASERPGTDPDNDREQRASSGAVSRIFGRKKNQDDGLSDLSAEEKAQAGIKYPERGRSQAPVRRTVSGAEIGQPATLWNAAEGDESVQKVYAEAARTARPRKREETETSDDFSAWRTPDAEARKKETRSWNQDEPKEEQRQDPPQTRLRPEGNRENERTAGETGRSISRSGRPETGEGRIRMDSSGTFAAEDRTRESGERKKAAKSSSWLDQVKAASAGQGMERGGLAGSAGAEDRAEAAGTEKENVSEKSPRVRVPVTQEIISDPVWKPELKRVETKQEEEEEEYWEPTPYVAPPITDLKRPEISAENTAAEDEDRSRRLEETLASFRVQARVVHVTHGPSISRFELELAPGVKVGKVAELERDIAYGMEATSVRIEAPIPGKSLVGVEVPNPKRATVTLREVLESSQMQNARSILTVALGKDIAGTPIICDLAKMPHMLIAGATGSGKSVCINTIINSLLFRAGPDDVKMIMVDPKVVELQCYNGLPHLLLPVVNDPHKAAAALAWAVAEMMERYDRFAERGVRNLEGYNSILEPGEKPMPRIVIIIDELADLMMVCKKDVEEYICRLTQLARAAGIHLIVATQRPSVDVITGLIKANIPSRIAFKTASNVDSRTILDRNGSERLLGWGDMLYLPTGSFAPIRIQGCFLSDEEVNRIANHVRQANPSFYDPDILDKLEQLSKGSEEGPSMDMVGGTADSGGADTNLFEQAVEYAIQDGQISTSTLQRRLKIGYARAGRLTDEMEERGIVSAKDGSKPRKCLITREEWEAIRAAGQ